MKHPGTNGSGDVWNSDLDTKQLRKYTSYTRAKSLIKESLHKSVLLSGEAAPYCLLIEADDTRLMNLTLPFLRLSCKDLFKCDFFVVPCYNANEVCIFNMEVTMDYSLCFEIPYGNRDRYIDLLIEVNKEIGEGYMVLFVNNNPYALQSLVLAVTTDEMKSHKVLEKVKRKQLILHPEKGPVELIMELGARKWGFKTIMPYATREDFARAFGTLFWFAEKNELEGKGYSSNFFADKPKLFISYCHADKDFVYAFTERLENCGVDFWIDKKDLESGSSLIRSIMEAISQCDLGVSFISKSMLHSPYGQAELEHMLSGFIARKKPWCFVRVDDVNVDELIPGISDYKYIDCPNGATIDDVLHDVLKKYERLHNEKLNKADKP